MPADSRARPFVSVAQPASDAEWLAARCLIEEYAASLDLDLSFQNIDHELAHLPTEYGPPHGAFLLAKSREGAYTGCVGVRRFSEGAGEIKRFYTRPEVRGRGVGRQLAQHAVLTARALGYQRLLLDTLPTMTAAHALYTALGFIPTAPYRFNPVPGTAYLVLELTDEGGAP